MGLMIGLVTTRMFWPLILRSGLPAQPMSALAHKPTFRSAIVMTAFAPKADVIVQAAGLKLMRCEDGVRA